MTDWFVLDARDTALGSSSSASSEAKAAYGGVGFRDAPYKEGWLPD